MRPKICVPIVAPLRDGIIREAKQIAKLPVEMVEWRIDFFAGYGREILDVITELKRVLNEKELLVTIRTVAEGGEENGSRFDYFETIRKILEQQTADYVDVEAARDVSFGCVSEASAPGQVYYETMCEVFDKIYKGNRHIILIGFMGVGKSTISHELSRLALRIEIDTDQWIEEKEGRAISDIFAKEGETYFRDLETSMIDELGMIKPAIISCGGGMALRELNVRKLQAIGTVVLLTAKPETIFERVRYNTNRPLLKDNMNVDYIRQMMEKRRVYYEHAATVTVSTDGKIITEIAKEILEKCF